MPIITGGTVIAPVTTIGGKFGKEDNSDTTDREFNSTGEFDRRYTHEESNYELHIEEGSEEFSAEIESIEDPYAYSSLRVREDYTRIAFEDETGLASFYVGNSYNPDLDAEEVAARIRGNVVKIQNDEGNVYNNSTETLTDKLYLVVDTATGIIKTFEPPVQPKVYRALLSQSGTDAPTAVVLENTLGGELVWNYIDVGVYRGILNGAFTENKTNIEKSKIVWTDSSLVGDDLFYKVYKIDVNTIEVVNYFGGVEVNNELDKHFIEILVYP